VKKDEVGAEGRRLALAAAMASWFDRPILATAEEQKTMDPLFCFIMGRARQRRSEKLELRFVAIVWLNSSSVVLWAGFRMIDPAQLAAPSIRPNFSSTFATQASTSPGLEHVF
jgi:hypothetical protein